MPVALMLRLRVRWNALELDSALADGADPEADAQLAVRAGQLAEAPNREQLAGSIDHLLELADRSSAQAALVRMPLRRDRVRAIRPRLVELAGRLRRQGPHPVRGLAMANLLIEDGLGPLYVHDRPDPQERPDRLERAVEEALAAIER